MPTALMRLFSLLERFTDGSFLLLCDKLFFLFLPFLNLDAQMKCSLTRYTNFQSDLDEPLEHVRRQLISERKHALGRKKLHLCFKHLRQSKKLERRKQKHFKVIIKSITRSFIMLNTIKENENTSFANISIPFLISGCQEKGLYCEHDLCCEHHLRKGMEISAKLVFSFSFIVFNIIKLLVMLFIMKFIAQINIFK